MGAVDPGSAIKSMMQMLLRVPVAARSCASGVQRRRFGVCGCLLILLLGPLSHVSSGNSNPASPHVLVTRLADAVVRDFEKPPPFDWGEGVLMTGMMRAWELTRNEQYLRFVQRFAEH